MLPHDLSHRRLEVQAQAMQETIIVEQIKDVFTLFSAEVTELYELADNKDNYRSLYHLINHYAWLNLVEYQATGSPKALRMLKYQVAFCLTMLP